MVGGGGKNAIKKKKGGGKEKRILSKKKKFCIRTYPHCLEEGVKLQIPFGKGGEWGAKLKGTINTLQTGGRESLSSLGEEEAKSF